MTAARHVAVGELVDQAHLGPAGDDGIDIHFFHRHTAILDLAAANHFEVLDLGFRIFAAVGLDEANHDVEPALLQRMRLLEHFVRLADPWCGPDVDSQPGAILLLDPRQQRVSGGASIRRGSGLVDTHVP